MKYCHYILGACLFLFVISCEPYIEDEVTIPELTDTPEFTVQMVEGDSNRFVVDFDPTGYFDFVWSIPGGSPSASSLDHDTIFFQRAGNYDITLHASVDGGAGVATATQSVVVENDAELECDAFMSLLTNDCSSKCWRLSSNDGGVAVGPIPLSGEWFTSTGLNENQADDLWCFDFTTASFLYINNDVTFSACAGFSEIVGYPIPDNMTYVVSPSDSDYSENQFILSDDFWMGVEDSGPIYEVVSITEDEMVLLTPIKPCDGGPSEGWFTLTFLAN